MQRATKDILYFETGPDNEPTMFVDPGEEFEVVTQMNRGPWIEGHPDQEKLEVSLTGGNPSSGAIYVNGAEPGQVLIVHVLDIQTEPFGFTRFRGSNGAMPGWMGATAIGHHEKIVSISDGLIHWSDALKFPLEPMLGVVGVAPSNARWTNAWAGQWGGNFDIQEIKAGASVRIPIQVPGALLHIGDMHARQGDGEICGAGGIETGGTARIRYELAPLPANMTWPRIEDDTHMKTTPT